MDVVAIAPEQTPTTGPMGRWSWISLGGRIRALDPAAWVGWALTLGLTTAVALLVLNTPLIPALQELAFAPRSPGEPLSAAELDELLADWFAFARVAGVSVVVGVLCARRSVVLGTVLTIWPFIAIPLFGPFVWGWWVALAAVAVCAAFSRPWRALVPYLLSVVVTVAFNAQYLTALFPDGQGTLGGPGGWWYVFGYSAYSGAAVALSAAIGVGLRSRARSAAARATERRALTIESTVAARAQLARDLHDVVAHHVSLVAVRAESAPYTYPDLGDEARKVLREIATDARSALDELRRVLGVLQRSEGGELAPQPGADDVATLVAEAQAAGQEVELAGGWSDVPATQGYVLYRAAQEGLTNARRHAPGAKAVLTLQQRADVVGFRLANPVTAPGPDGEPGRGLIGMRERVEALGGAVSAGVQDGTFVVVVALPLESR